MRGGAGGQDGVEDRAGDVRLVDLGVEAQGYTGRGEERFLCGGSRRHGEISSRSAPSVGRHA